MRTRGRIKAFGARMGRLAGGVVPVVASDFLDDWIPTQGHFTDTAGTTPAVNNGDSIKCWTGVRGNKLRNISAGNFALWVKDAFGTGIHSLNLAHAFLCSQGSPGTMTPNAMSIVAVVKRQNTTEEPIVGQLATLDDQSTSTLFLNDGYQRPDIGNVNTYLSSDIGYPTNNYAALGFASTATSHRFCVNDRLSRTITSSLGSTTFPGLCLGTINGLFSGGQIAQLTVYNRTLSDTDLRNTCIAKMMSYNIALIDRARNIVYRGNSITAGAFSVYKPYCDKATTDAGATSWDYRNYGVSGNTISDLSTADATLAPALFESGMRNIVVLYEISNSLASNVAAATVLTQLAAWVAIWRAAGFTVVTCTVQDRDGLFTGGATAVSYRADAATVNTAVSTNAGGIYGDFIAAVASDANIGASGAADSGTYFNADKVHPIQAGHDLIAAKVATALTSAL